MELPAQQEMQRLVRQALEEDIGSGDITTLATVDPDARAGAHLVAREPLIVSGTPLVEEVFRQLDGSVTVRTRVVEGGRVKGGETILELEGKTRSLLTGERVALNLMQRLSAVATLTRQYVDAVQDTQATILDTRKTTPGLRTLEKYAVRCGGGQNHRFGLFDAVLIKDNHLASLRGARPNAIAAAVQRSREKHPGKSIEVEADTLEQVTQAVEAGADIVLLDNMSTLQLRLAVQQLRGRAKSEASGGVNLASIQQIAQTGVDYISVGALTHSAHAVDIALDLYDLGDH